MRVCIRVVQVILRVLPVHATFNILLQGYSRISLLILKNEGCVSRQAVVQLLSKTAHVTICCKRVLLSRWSDCDLLTSHVHVLQSKPTIDSRCEKNPQEVSRRFTGCRVFVNISSFIVVFIYVHVCIPYYPVWRSVLLQNLGSFVWGRPATCFFC